MNILSIIKLPFEFLSDVADSLATISDRLTEIVRQNERNRPPGSGTGGGYATGKSCRQFVIARSADRAYSQRIPVTDVLRWRFYYEIDGGAYATRLELVCAVRHVGEHEEALGKIRACTGKTVVGKDDEGRRHIYCTSGPELLVGVIVTDRHGESRALHLRDPKLWKHEYRCDGFSDRVLAVYTFSGDALDWGDVPTTNDPDAPRVGMNVGEIPTVETVS